MAEGVPRDALKSDKGPKDWKSTMKHLFAGGVAGAVSRTAVSPLERLKILFQVQLAVNNPKYKGVVQSLSLIGKEEGIRGYFKGNGTNVIRIIPYSAVQFAAYEKFKPLLLEPGKSDLSPRRRLVAGALAGITSVTCTYPLDLIRTRLSLAEVSGKAYSGIADAFLKIIKQEGVIALFKGIVPTLMGIAPYVGLNFMTYETLKAKVRIYKKGKDPTTIQLLFCGGVAGAVAQTITYPLDVLRRKMQIQGFGSHKNYGSTRNAILWTWRDSGIYGFYRGLLPNYLKVVPSISISFVVYEKTKAFLDN